MVLKFRYTLEEDVSRHEMVKQWICREVTGYCVIQHDADEDVSRTHWHAVFYTAKDISTLRKSFRKLMVGISPDMYELGKVRDGDEEVYERYMCHAGGRGDSVKVIVSQGLKYTQEWAQDQNERFYAEQDKFKERIKKKGKQSTVEELVDECKAQNITSVRGVVEQVYCMWRRQKRVINEVYMSQVVKGVCVQLEIGKYVKSLFVDRMMDNFFLE